MKLLYEPVCPSVSRSVVGWLVDWSICHYFLKGREVTLPCSLPEHLFFLDIKHFIFSFINCADFSVNIDLTEAAARSTHQLKVCRSWIPLVFVPFAEMLPFVGYLMFSDIFKGIYSGQPEKLFPPPLKFFPVFVDFFAVIKAS